MGFLFLMSVSLTDPVMAIETDKVRNTNLHLPVLPGLYQSAITFPYHRSYAKTEANRKINIYK